MQSTPQTIAHLQAQLKVELTAINQYYVHYRMLKHWALGALAHKSYKASIERMQRADKLMERIFMLEGLPNLQDLGKLRIAEDVPELLQCDLAAEMDAQATLKKGIAHCEQERDYVTRDLFRRLLDDSENYIDFVQTQIALMEKTGRQNYIQSQIGEE